MRELRPAYGTELPTRTRRLICRCFCFGAREANRRSAPRNSLTYGDAAHQTSSRTRPLSAATTFKKRRRTRSSNTSLASSKRKDAGGCPIPSKLRTSPSAWNFGGTLRLRSKARAVSDRERRRTDQEAGFRIERLGKDCDPVKSTGRYCLVLLRAWKRRVQAKDPRTIRTRRVFTVLRAFAEGRRPQPSGPGTALGSRNRD
jgi:hypothetical protein